MAKFLLGLFGGFSVLAGFITIAGALSEKNEIARLFAFYWAGGFLLAGAPLLGGARVIVLLERIEMNTRPTKPDAPLTLEESIARNARDRVGR